MQTSQPRPKTGAQPGVAVIRNAEEKLAATFHAMEAQLGGSDYLAGDTVTLTDPSFVPYTDFLLQGLCVTLRQTPRRPWRRSPAWKGRTRRSGAGFR